MSAKSVHGVLRYFAKRKTEKQMQDHITLLEVNLPARGREKTISLRVKKFYLHLCLKFKGTLFYNCFPKKSTNVAQNIITIRPNALLKLASTF